MLPRNGSANKVNGASAHTQNDLDERHRRVSEHLGNSFVYPHSNPCASKIVDPSRSKLPEFIEIEHVNRIGLGNVSVCIGEI
jgi:hypothetical protein